MRTPFMLAGVASVCLLLSACGGGGDSTAATPTAQPTALPATVTIAAAASVDVSSAAPFASDAPAGTDVQLHWDFGDGGSSDDTKPSHRYAQPGEYQVTLTVTNSAGDERSSSFTVTAGRLSLVQGLNCSGASNTGWCWQRPQPTGNTINDLTFVDETTGWAVGDAGQILKTTDGGATWNIQASGSIASLTQVRFADGIHGWATGTSGAVLRTADGGATWVAQSLGFAYSAGVTIDASNMQTGGTEVAAIWDGQGSVRETLDGGATWSIANSGYGPVALTPNGTLWTVQGVPAGSANDFVYAVRSSTDGGKTYTTRQQWNDTWLYQVSFADDLHGWLTGGVMDFNTGITTFKMWRTVDGGASWQPLSLTGLGDISNWYNMSSIRPQFYDARNGWLVGDNGTVYHSPDGGTTWSAVTPAGGGQLLSTPDAKTAAFSTYPSTVAVTRDAGATWQTLQVPAEATAYYSYPNAIRVVGNAYWLRYADRWYRSSDNGATWTQSLGGALKDAGAAIASLWFFDGMHGLAASNGGWLLDTDDGGNTWNYRVATSLSPWGQVRMQFKDANNGWMLYGQYGIWTTNDGGKSWWEPAPIDNVSTTISDFHFADASNGWSVDTSGTIRHSSDGGKTWVDQTTLSFPLLGVRFADAQHGVAVGQGGNIAQTADGGATWTLRLSGTTDDLRRVTFADAHTAWVISGTGTMLRSDDAGEHWQRVDDLPRAAGLSDIAFADAQHGWAVGAFGSVLATADGGQTWHVQSAGTGQDLYSIVPADSRTAWVVGANGSVLVTATGGQ